MPPRVVVVRSAFGGVLAELGGWLAAEMRSLAADVRACAVDDPAVGAADLVVLLGAGQEFEPVLRTRRRNRTVVLWTFDPVPPPDMGAAALARGVRRARLATALRRFERAAPGAWGEPGTFSRRRLLARRAAIRLAAGPATAINGAHPTDGLFAFSRLGWLERSVGAGHVDRVLASSPAAVETLWARGVPAEYQPVVRHAEMGRNGGGDRDIAALFLGSGLDGRASRLARLEADLAAHGVPLTVVDRQCFGAERTALLNRTQVVVNLHKFPWHLERIRLLLATANGAIFASELPIPDSEPFVAGRDFVAAPEDGLAAAIAAHVDSPARGVVAAAAGAVYEALPDLRSIARSLLEAA